MILASEPMAWSDVAALSVLFVCLTVAFIAWLRQ